MSAPSVQIFTTPRHTTRYLRAGPAEGPLMFFLHGWPELAQIWIPQMDAFAAEGWCCIVPDMRGYGGSSAPTDPGAYTQEHVVKDMVELHDHLGGQPAIWIGHDWGSVAVASLASHEPARCRGAVLVSVPYFPTANALKTLVPLVDRHIYPASDYPDGQWDYYRYYTTHFASAVADLDADIAASLASIFRSGKPGKMNEPAANATVTRRGGRFGAAHRAPPTEPDQALWSAREFEAFVDAFEAAGFRAPCAWYLNDEANMAYAAKAVDGGRLSLPVLFVNGDYDQMNSIIGNRLGDPMRASCSDLVITHLAGAHWLPLERRTDLIIEIRHWLTAKRLVAPAA